MLQVKSSFSRLYVSTAATYLRPVKSVDKFQKHEKILKYFQMSTFCISFNFTTKH